MHIRRETLPRISGRRFTAVYIRANICREASFLDDKDVYDTVYRTLSFEESTTTSLHKRSNGVQVHLKKFGDYLTPIAQSQVVQHKNVIRKSVTLVE